MCIEPSQGHVVSVRYGPHKLKSIIAIRPFTLHEFPQATNADHRLPNAPLVIGEEDLERSIEILLHTARVS